MRTYPMTYTTSTLGVKIPMPEFGKDTNIQIITPALRKQIMFQETLDMSTHMCLVGGQDVGIHQE